jgi:hypothetical protein
MKMSPGILNPCCILESLHIALKYTNAYTLFTGVHVQGACEGKRNQFFLLLVQIEGPIGAWQTMAPPRMRASMLQHRNPGRILLKDSSKCKRL